MIAVLRPRLEQMAYAGMIHGADKLGIAFDASLYNQQAAQWARSYTDTLLQQLQTTTEEGVGQILSDWIASPTATMGDLVQQIVESGLAGADRASRIAVTETTRAFASGERMTYLQNGIGKWRWQTNNDDIVCKYCEPLNQKIVDIGTAFGDDANGDPVYQPPGHINCRCWTSPVING
jgi:SPP1 gp7 family putative phage head morphogenesis protein